MWLVVLALVFGQWCRFREWRMNRRIRAVSDPLCESPARSGGEVVDGIDASDWGPVAELTQARYLSAWDALGGRAARLRLLAISSDEVAQSCREAALTGGAPWQLLGVDDYCDALPDELRDTAGRPGDQQAWQALDRALARLSAIVVIPQAAMHADAHEHVALAAGALADELEVAADLEHCWFCGRSSDQVDHLLCSTHAAICDDCVQACHEQLSEL